MGIRLQRLLATTWAEMRFPQCCAPGHFYSPIPSPNELRRDRQRIFDGNVADLPEIRIREAEQLKLVGSLGKQSATIHLGGKSSPPRRYYIENDYFFSKDATVFAAMLMENRPRNYVEIGSGFSSALALDLSDELFGEKLKFTFIEPDTDRLVNLLHASDKERVVIQEKRVQEVPDRTFQELERNDVLFVDGSHVSKVGSDLNDVLFRVLPLLKDGVLIHFHDVFWPFEYPERDVLAGRSWNEAYLLRAFLANNAKYRIELFASWLERLHPWEWHRAFPAVGSDRASSLWLRKSPPEG